MAPARGAPQGEGHIHCAFLSCFLQGTCERKRCPSWAGLGPALCPAEVTLGFARVLPECCPPGCRACLSPCAHLGGQSGRTTCWGPCTSGHGRVPGTLVVWSKTYAGVEKARQPRAQRQDEALGAPAGTRSDVRLWVRAERDRSRAVALQGCWVFRARRVDGRRLARGMDERGPLGRGRGCTWVASWFGAGTSVGWRGTRSALGLGSCLSNSTSGRRFLCTKSTPVGNRCRCDPARTVRLLGSPAQPLSRLP